MERIEKLKELLRLDPADSFVQHALALEYIKLGDDQFAKKIFEELLDREPNYVGSYYHLAKLHERLGNESAAITVYETGMKIATQVGDKHAFNELRAAHDELIF